MAEFRHRLFLVLMVLLGAFALILGDIIGDSLRPVTIRSVEHQCARQLGIAYTVEDGATEMLDSFHSCVIGKGGANSTILHN